MTKQERYRARKVAKGICSNCTKPRDPDGTATMCRACADRVAARTNEWYWGLDWKGRAKSDMRNRRNKALKRQKSRR